MAEIDPDCREFISISETMFGNFRMDRFIRNNPPKDNYMAFKRSWSFAPRFFDTREEAIIFSRMLFPGVKILVSVSYRKKFINIAWKLRSEHQIFTSEIREYFRNAEDLSL